MVWRMRLAVTVKWNQRPSRSALHRLLPFIGRAARCAPISEVKQRYDRSKRTADAKAQETGI